MKIYTKTGDRGQTGLLGGERVSKSDARVEAIGTVDELNAMLGLLCADPLEPKVGDVLEKTQHDLFAIGAILAAVDHNKADPNKLKKKPIGRDHIRRLEEAIDQFEAELPPLTQFILPGGMRSAALVHLARTVCRRAERRVVVIVENRESAPESVIVYLNRLSDLLFVLARWINQQAGKTEHPWQA